MVNFKRSNNRPPIHLLLYVDDMLIATKKPKEIEKVNAQLNKEFEINDLGAVKKIFSMEILRDMKAG